MTAKLRTPAQIALLVERRQAQLLAEVTPIIEPFAGGVMGFHELGSWQNQACGVGLDGPVEPAQLDELIEFYRSRGAVPQVELSPFAHASLVEGLAERGFVVREFENVLAFDLSAGPELEDGLLERGWPEGLELERIAHDNAESIALATELSMRGFFPEGELPPAMVEASRATFARPSTVSFLARVEGRAVATGSVSLGEQVACLIGVSTEPEYRRRGIQQALMLARLQVAREQGCVLAMIGSRPGIPTERNAIRMGFTMAYTKVLLTRPEPGLVPSH